jgi:hypothetical protein
MQALEKVTVAGAVAQHNFAALPLQTWIFPELWHNYCDASGSLRRNRAKRRTSL